MKFLIAVFVLLASSSSVSLAGSSGAWSANVCASHIDYIQGQLDNGLTSADVMKQLEDWLVQNPGTFPEYAPMVRTMINATSISGWQAEQFRACMEVMLPYERSQGHE